jgi:regulator of replication initiation timing
MLSQSEQIANLERQVAELDARYTAAVVELAKLRSENTTLKLVLDGADAIERSLRDRLHRKEQN